MEDAQATSPATEEQTPAGEDVPTGSPGFSERGRMRRRARFLRKARELAYRDLGGLVFNLHRFGQRNDVLVIAKLSTLGHIDAELRALEMALARTSDVIAVFADINSLQVNSSPPLRARTGIFEAASETLHRAASKSLRNAFCR